ncbi:MAG: YCF48-related protein [Clostridiales bacterium]
MILRTIITILFAFCFQLYAQITPQFQWRTIKTDINSSFVKITFSDSLHGWAMTQYELARTTDGGESWQEQTLPVDSLDLRRILFTSSSTGYITGEKGLILATKDGGSHWIKQNSGDNDHLLRGISFLNDSTGWVTGEMDDGKKRGGILLHTTNGGEKWDTLSDRSDGILYYAVNFQDNNNGIIIGSKGWDNLDLMKIYRTTDGGKNLNMVNQFGGVQTFALYRAGKDTLWSGGFGFMKSIDYGISWNRYSNVELPDSTKYLLIFEDLLPIGGKKGYAVISDVRGADKITLRLHYTEDEGDNWKIVSTPEGFQPLAVCKGGNYFYLAGYEGQIITNRPKSMGIEKKVSGVSSFQLMQNYPNPFNPSTTIEFFTPNESQVSLVVYNLLGKEVKCLVNEHISAGRYKMQWDGADNYGKEVPSGVYLFNLKIGNKSELKKALLLR